METSREMRESVGGREREIGGGRESCSFFLLVSAGLHIVYCNLGISYSQIEPVYNEASLLSHTFFFTKALGTGEHRSSTQTFL